MNDDNFLNLLKELGNQIPRFSTDFITPEGIDWKKLKKTARTASFKSILPACSLATDLAMKLLENSNNRAMKDFVGFARNSIALYSILDNIHANVQPSNSMENRAEIVFWKEMAGKFNLEIPICDHYSGACAGAVPLCDILMYLTYRMKPKHTYEFCNDDRWFDFTIEGIEGNPPTINSTGNIIITSQLCVLIRCRQLKEQGGDPLVETLYVLKMDKFTADAATKEGGMTALTSDGDGAKYIGGQILSEHAAFVTEHPSYSSEYPVQACLAYIYRELDPVKYHYYVDSNRIYVRPNEERTDGAYWVQSKTMSQISEWCFRAAERGQSMSYALVGPLGTGKTSTCEHIMDDLAKRGFMIVKCKLDKRSLDSTLERIMFCMNMTQKSVVLLDELDKLGIKNANSEVNSLITFFGRMRELKSPAIIMSTINNPLEVHESIMERSGRIDETIEVGFPDEELMDKLLDNYCRKEGYNIPKEVHDFTVKKLVAAKISAADVENFTRQIYVKNGKKDVYTQEDLDLVISSFTGSREASRKNYYQRKETTTMGYGEIDVPSDCQ